MKKIYTYFEPPGDPIVNLFCESWLYHGWTPIILTKDLAKTHPLYDTYMRNVAEYPTVNGKDYELTCFRRWLAFAQTDGGIFSDYDIINYGQMELMHSDKIINYFNRGPALNFLPKVSIEKIVHYLMSYSVDYDILLKIGEHNHVSDMKLFQLLKLPCITCVAESHIPETLNRGYKLIHYGGLEKPKARIDWNNYLGTRSASTNLPVTE